MPKYLSPKGAAEFLGISVSTIRRYIREKRLPSWQPVKRGRILIERSALTNLWESPQLLNNIESSDRRRNPGPTPRWKRDGRQKEK